MKNFNVLENQVLESIEGLKKGSRQVIINTVDNLGEKHKYVLYHQQDCCEDVNLNDFELDPDIIGEIILQANEDSNKECGNSYESMTWTFYRLRTMHGTLFLKWLGSSNGYYSESVTFEEVEKN